MKKLLFIPVAAFVGAAMVGFMSNEGHLRISRFENAHKLDNSGATAGKTGAPGENSCTQCHSGVAQNGNGVNQVVMTENANVVTSYMPGVSYNVAVNMTDFSSINGFQIVALTPANAQAGSITIIPGSGTQLKNGAAGKKYVTHTLAGNVQNTWAFTWTAPATNVGTVTFYLATNKTNAQDNSSGDVIYLSQHPFGSVAAVKEAPEVMELEAGYQPSNHSLLLTYSALTSGESSVNVVDLNGKSVFNESVGHSENGLNKKTVKLPTSLENGIYIVHFNVNNTFVSKKIYIKN